MELRARWNAWRERRLRRKNCMHHDRRSGTSWVKEQIIDGARKMYWCTGKDCGKVWIW